ncbi:MAG: hypothetical protein BWY21_02153 [Parcubacteria group bacterium ADurb.Bin216]|nr:MAG: hypothetical protein BWY21_02153 [Parcubacteria group bacterium ADurb.Bin216]
MENLNSFNKEKLINLIKTLQEDKTKLETAVNETVSIANYFGAKLLAIEALLHGLPPKGNGRQLLWFISNAKKLVLFLEGIAAQIKEWRTEIAKLQKAPDTAEVPSTESTDQTA